VLEVGADFKSLEVKLKVGFSEANLSPVGEIFSLIGETLSKSNLFIKKSNLLETF
jgi:hypothetical protein